MSLNTLSRKCLTNIIVLSLGVVKKPITIDELMVILFLLERCGILQDIRKVVCNE